MSTWPYSRLVTSLKVFDGAVRSTPPNPQELQPVHHLSAPQRATLLRVNRSTAEMISEADALHAIEQSMVLTEQDNELTTLRTMHHNHRLGINEGSLDV